MLGEASLLMHQAYEDYLDAKKAFEEWRDGYMPYFEDKREYEERLEVLMRNMDYAEDTYNLLRLEYDEIVTEEYRDWLYEEEHDQKFPKMSLEDLHDRAEEYKQRYDDLAEGRTPFMGSAEDLASELERLRHEWQDALNDFNDEYGLYLLQKKREELGLKRRFEVDS